MINFVTKYPKDNATQEKLCVELLDYFDQLQAKPSKLTEPRFIFLLSYFKLNGNTEIKNLCEYWIKEVG